MNFEKCWKLNCLFYTRDESRTVESAISHCAVCFAPEMNHDSASYFSVRCLFHTRDEPRFSQPFLIVLFVLHQRWTTVQPPISHCVVCFTPEMNHGSATHFSLSVVCFTPEMNHGSVSHFSLCCLFYTRDEPRFSQPFLTVLFVLHQRWTTVQSPISHCVVCFTPEMKHSSVSHFNCLNCWWTSTPSWSIGAVSLLH